MWYVLVKALLEGDTKIVLMNYVGDILVTVNQYGKDYELTVPAHLASQVTIEATIEKLMENVRLS